MLTNHINSGKIIIDTVKLTDSYKINYWSKRFNVPLKVLRQAIEKVGNNVKDIEKFLKRMRN